MSLEVRLRDPDGQLESVSDLQLLNGRNAALVVDADGGAELIQFRDVTPLGNDIYRLSTLLRGRRGTEARLAHAPGAVIVVLDDDGALFTEPLGLIGQPLRYRGVGRGEAFDEADTVTQTLRGTDLKPYAPAHVAGAWTAAGITLSWRRRTRIGGDWRDGTGTVPLAEAAEAYEVDILDVPGCRAGAGECHAAGALCRGGCGGRFRRRAGHAHPARPSDQRGGRARLSRDSATVQET